MGQVFHPDQPGEHRDRPAGVRDRAAALLLAVQLLEPVAVGEEVGAIDTPVCAAAVERDVGLIEGDGSGPARWA